MEATLWDYPKLQNMARFNLNPVILHISLKASSHKLSPISSWINRVIKLQECSISSWCQWWIIQNIILINVHNVQLYLPKEMQLFQNSLFWSPWVSITYIAPGKKNSQRRMLFSGAFWSRSIEAVGDRGGEGRAGWGGGGGGGKLTCITELMSVFIESISTAQDTCIGTCLFTGFFFLNASFM